MSIHYIVAKEHLHESTQAEQSDEVTSIQQEVIIYSTSSNNCKYSPPINYAAPTEAITKECIKEMLNQAMHKQKEETQERLELYVEQQM